MTITRWKFTIEYKGTAFHGWQRQKGHDSAQQSIEEAIFKFCQQKATLHGAGRTDSGVHARGQVAHCDLEDFSQDMDGSMVTKAINAHLRPFPVSILKSEKTDEKFHARFDAINKLYQYRIINRSSFLTIDEGFAWHVKYPLDVKAMQDAAQRLLGHHDFTSFRDSACQAKSPMRTLDRLDVSQDGEDIRIETESRSFLHHQVRNMAGSLKLVGEGKWNADDLQEILEAKDRTKSGPTAPADGLYLMRVDYPSI